MNPRQRRGAVLMILACAGAVFVFISIVGYVGAVRAEVGAMTTVLRLKQAVPAYAAVSPAMVEPVEVPRKWSPETMITQTRQLTGMVASADLQPGSYLQRGMLVPQPSLQPGQREIAIMIDAETGVAGKVRPGMFVDIYATFQEQNAQQQRNCAVRVIQRALILQIGAKTTQRSGDQAAQAAQAARGEPQQVVPITFALSANDSLKLTYAESYAGKVRLALIGERQEVQPPKLAPVCQTPATR